MSRVSATINIPAIGQTHDFLLPLNMQVSDIIALVVKILSSEYGVSNNSDGLVLLDKSDGNALDASTKLSKQGVSDGAELILL